MSSPLVSTHEWLEADGLGGFASGTATGIRTRRYHALLLTATTPPTGRLVLVNGFDAWVETRNGTFSLSSQRYAPDVLHPDGAHRIESFESEPWPYWEFKLEDGTRISQEIFSSRNGPLTCLNWNLLESTGPVKLFVRVFLSGRDYHALHRANPSFRFEAQSAPGQVSWHPYDGVPGVRALSNGQYTHAPEWYYNFLYEAEQSRGLDCIEDLASPGIMEFDLTRSEATLILTTPEFAETSLPSKCKPAEFMRELRAEERKARENFLSALHRAADAYIVRGQKGTTIMAGYPWFTDWGRDTFIALRGLCLATGRLEEAREILLGWTSAISEGMLPNRFPDQGEAPEFNSVDASLWFIIAAHEYLEAVREGHHSLAPTEKRMLQQAIVSILTGYAQGTRFGIRMDADGLLAAGVPGLQLTWMDAKVGDWVVTPRIGKPVEIQALWLNALKIGSGINRNWDTHYQRGLEAFRARFWNESTGSLCDVIDCDQEAGKVDTTFRPNQIFAIGGLPFALLEGEQALKVVSAVEQKLSTPFGLRSLAPDETGYTARYQGGVRERDGAYHQGTVWPWLIGPFVEAWVRVRGNTPEAKRAARTKFLEPLLSQSSAGHISEIADAETPHTPRGCPFQAWSTGEALRLEHVVLASPRRTQKRSRELVTA